jgi:hypothetical protein
MSDRTTCILVDGSSFFYRAFILRKSEAVKFVVEWQLALLLKGQIQV